MIVVFVFCIKTLQLMLILEELLAFTCGRSLVYQRVMVIRCVDRNVVVGFNLEQYGIEENVLVQLQCNLRSYLTCAFQLFCSAPVVWMLLLLCPCSYPCPIHPNVTLLNAVDGRNVLKFQLAVSLVRLTLYFHMPS